MNNYLLKCVYVEVSKKNYTECLPGPKSATSTEIRVDMLPYSADIVHFGCRESYIYI